MKHPARWIALAVALVVVVFGVVLAVNVGNDPQADAQQSPFLGQGGARRSTSRRSTGGTVSNAVDRGQGGDHQLLEHVVHPVPSRRRPRSKEFYARARGRPRLRDGRHRARSTGEHEGDHGRT